MCFSASSAAIRVLVVDNSLPFREASRDLIEQTPDFSGSGTRTLARKGSNRLLARRRIWF
jgi:hypothetical protein